MTPLAPWMLLGGAAVSIPIALHFFYRARHKPLPWAPMRFLKEAIEQTSRRLKFQEWILLALRCLAILLLALALARIGRDDASTAGSGQAIDAVFVIDTSYSMAALDGDKTRFERAKAAALAVLDTLPDKSTIQIYSSSDRATPLGPSARSNRDQAKQIIQSLELSSLPTDFLDGLTQALAAAETGTASAKEIYVFTDMQKSGFDQSFSAIRAKCEEIRGKAALIFIRCGSAERKVPNATVTGVKLTRAIPHTGTAVPFEITLKNTGREPLLGLKVGLEMDGKSVEKDWAVVDKLDPGASTTVTLTGGVKEAGARMLKVHIEGDGLPGDNVYFSIVGVRDKVRVLLVAPPIARTDPEDAAADWFVRWAFYPFDAQKDKEKIKQYFIETERVTPTAADPEKLANKDVCYLLNVAARTDDPLAGLPPKFVERLTEFVRKGGGLVIGCGDQVKTDPYNRVFGGAGLLPLPLGPERNTTQAAPFAPAPESVAANSFLAPLRVTPFSDALGQARLTRMFALDETNSAGTQVLMRTTDGKPLVVSRPVGDGEVVLFATSLDESWGRMMSDGRLAGPLTTFTVAHLTSRKVPGGIRYAGDELAWHPPTLTESYELVKPARAGESTRLRVNLGPAKAEAGQRPVVTTRDTLVAGEYAIVPTGTPKLPEGKPGEVGVRFVVNPDLRETENLDAISDGDLEKGLGFRPTIIPAGAGTETAVRDRRTRSEWTELVLLVLLLVLVGEAVWAWMCGRAW